LYISATHSAVSGALVVEKEIKKNDKTAKQQFSLYFVSEVLTGSKKFYSEMEKICYTVIMSSRKLRHYFEAHTIKVVTNQPLNDIFGNRDSSGRISKWAMVLSEYVIDFEKRNARSPTLRQKVRCLKHHGLSIVTDLGGDEGWNSSGTHFTFRN
jgi:hypothetical protein